MDRMYAYITCTQFDPLTEGREKEREEQQRYAKTEGCKDRNLEKKERARGSERNEEQMQFISGGGN